MIGWTDLPPDASAAPSEALFATLSVPDAVELLARLAAGPVVLVSAQCRAGVLAHLGSEGFEQGGLLLGRVFAPDGDPSRPEVVCVEGHVPASVFSGTGISLRMGTAVWEAAQRQCAAGQSVVGWYHSHPGLGAFFSGTDRQTQAAFFANAFDVGWVIDPLRGEERMFLGPGCEEVGGAEGTPLRAGPATAS